MWGSLFSHVVELARLGDPTTRARLAMDTTRQNWSVDQLKDAIGQVNLGNCCDTDGATPGTQPPPAKGELEKAVEEVDSWSSQWAEADTSNLRGFQRERYKKALEALKAKVAAMETRLG